MLIEDYVSFETAKLLKEKGFDESCFGFYTPEKELHFTFLEETNSTWLDDSISAPTLQMAMKWLREVYGICIELLFHPNKEDWGWYFQILVVDNIKKCFCGYGPYKTYSSYEEACEAAIKHCLKNLI